MPTRCPGSQNFRFNRTVKGVGRIVNSSGTADPVEFRYRDGILTKLIKNQALDILRPFKAGTVSIGELIAADREGRLLRVVGDMKLSQPLESAVLHWLESAGNTPASRVRYRTSWRSLKRKARFRPSFTIRDLAGVDWKRLRGRWKSSGTDWNRMRAMLSSFLTDVTGSVHSPFRLEVMARLPLAQENAGRVPDIDAALLWQIVDAALPKVRSVYAALAILGVGPKEMMGIRAVDLRPERHEVIVNGTKAAARQRIVCVEPELWPWVSAAVPCPLAYKWLRIHFKRAVQAVGHQKGTRPDRCACAICALTMYDLRHLSAQLAADKGASLRDLMTHLGHTQIKTTFRYARRTSARAVASHIGEALKR